MSGEDDYASWNGRSEESTDTASAAQVAGLAALLDDLTPDWPVGELPPLAHWLHFRPDAPQSALGEDGHPRRGADSFLPPLELPRRMWAGGRLAFLGPIPIGAAMTQRTTVRSVARKTGRSGAMILVTLEHEIGVGGEVAIREEQDLVYRKAATPGASAAAAPRPDPPAAGARTITPTSTHLFRYSALTFNAHRIHYDRDYARDVEGYPGLVVQGPYLATLLLAHALGCGPRRTLGGFAFRAQAPAFADAPLALRLDGDRVEARSAGSLCMVAELR